MVHSRFSLPLILLRVVRSGMHQFGSPYSGLPPKNKSKTASASNRREHTPLHQGRGRQWLRGEGRHYLPPPFWRPRPLGPSPPKEHHGRRGCWCLLASETTPGQRLADDGPLARGRAETPWPSWPSLSVSYARWLALVPAVCFFFFCFALLTVDSFTQNDYKRELRLPRKGVPHKTVPLGKA